MDGDLQANLTNYKQQLQQVEAALTTDPDNEDLAKLRSDLLEVIALTGDLAEQQNSTAIGATSGSVTSTTAVLGGIAKNDWIVGEKCMAIWAEDDLYYDAVVDEIMPDGSCTVTFAKYGTTIVTTIPLLRLPGSVITSAEEKQKAKTKRDLAAAQREYKRKKSQKKAQRLKQMEEEREGEKNKWLDFNAKTFAKTNKGKVKKSIFATPDSVTGRVGVGTCNSGGKPMTHFHLREKWKKN